MEKHQVKLYTSDGGMKLIKRCVAAGNSEACLEASGVTNGGTCMAVIAVLSPWRLLSDIFEDRRGGRLRVVLAGQGAGAALVVQRGDSSEVDTVRPTVLRAGSWLAWVAV